MVEPQNERLIKHKPPKKQPAAAAGSIENKLDFGLLLYVIDRLLRSRYSSDYYATFFFYFFSFISLFRSRTLAANWLIDLHQIAHETHHRIIKKNELIPSRVISPLFSSLHAR